LRPYYKTPGGFVPPPPPHHSSCPLIARAPGRFPLANLDLAPFTSPASPERHSAQYQLCGITHHSGSTEGGHYIAHCRNYDDGAWYCFNDGRVSPVAGPPVDGSAYMLFYVRGGS
jgi:hypothetical protein